MKLQDFLDKWTQNIQTGFADSPPRNITAQKMREFVEELWKVLRKEWNPATLVTDTLEIGIYNGMLFTGIRISYNDITNLFTTSLWNSGVEVLKLENGKAILDSDFKFEYDNLPNWNLMLGKELVAKNHIRWENILGNPLDSTSLAPLLGSGLEDVTISEMQILISNNQLKPGQFYLIKGIDTTLRNVSDLNNGTWVIVQALDEKTLATEGWGRFWNPDYSNIQIFSPETDNITLGQKRIWGGVVWELVGTYNTLFVDAWDLSSNGFQISTNQDDYVVVWDKVGINIENERITFRQDKDGNIVYRNTRMISSNNINFGNTIGWFPWGYNNDYANLICKDNFVDKTSVVYLLNEYFTNFSGNKIEKFSFFGVQWNYGSKLISESYYETGTIEIDINSYNHNQKNNSGPNRVVVKNNSIENSKVFGLIWGAYTKNIFTETKIEISNNIIKNGYIYDIINNSLNTGKIEIRNNYLLNPIIIGIYNFSQSQTFRLEDNNLENLYLYDVRIYQISPGAASNGLDISKNNILGKQNYSISINNCWFYFNNSNWFYIINNNFYGSAGSNLGTCINFFNVIMHINPLTSGDFEISNNTFYDEDSINMFFCILNEKNDLLIYSNNGINLGLNNFASYNGYASLLIYENKNIDINLFNNLLSVSQRNETIIFNINGNNFSEIVINGFYFDYPDIQNNFEISNNSDCSIIFEGSSVTLSGSYLTNYFYFLCSENKNSNINISNNYINFFGSDFNFEITNNEGSNFDIINNNILTNNGYYNNNIIFEIKGNTNCLLEKTNNTLQFGNINDNNYRFEFNKNSGKSKKIPGDDFNKFLFSNNNISSYYDNSSMRFQIEENNFFGSIFRLTNNEFTYEYELKDYVNKIVKNNFNDDVNIRYNGLSDFEIFGNFVEKNLDISYNSFSKLLNNDNKNFILENNTIKNTEILSNTFNNSYIQLLNNYLENYYFNFNNNNNFEIIFADNNLIFGEFNYNNFISNNINNSSKITFKYTKAFNLYFNATNLSALGNTLIYYNCLNNIFEELNYSYNNFTINSIDTNEKIFIFNFMECNFYNFIISNKTITILLDYLGFGSNFFSFKRNIVNIFGIIVSLNIELSLPLYTDISFENNILNKYSFNGGGHKFLGSSFGYNNNTLFNYTHTLTSDQTNYSFNNTSLYL